MQVRALVIGLSLFPKGTMLGNLLRSSSNIEGSISSKPGMIGLFSCREDLRSGSQGQLQGILLTEGLAPSKCSQEPALKKGEVMQISKYGICRDNAFTSMGWRVSSSGSAEALFTVSWNKCTHMLRQSHHWQRTDRYGQQKRASVW